jgi:hypothetical protein
MMMNPRIALLAGVANELADALEGTPIDDLDLQTRQRFHEVSERIVARLESRAATTTIEPADAVAQELSIEFEGQPFDDLDDGSKMRYLSVGGRVVAFYGHAKPPINRRN